MQTCQPPLWLHIDQSLILLHRYVESPPESEDEKAALAQLLDACLGGDSGLHGEYTRR